MSITKNALIKKETINGKEVFVTDTYIMAEEYSIRHQHVLKNAFIAIEDTLKVTIGDKPNIRLISETLKLRVSKISKDDFIFINSHIEKLGFKFTTFNDSSKRTQKVLIVNELGYMLLIQHINTPKNEKARLILAGKKYAFAQAFFLMRDIIKNQPQPIEELQDFGELSKTGNGLARTEIVKKYPRSAKHSELSQLLGKRKRFQNRLNGLFDTDTLREIEKIDILIVDVQKTIQQEKEVEKLLNKKLLK